jgi:hypothetical protein
MAQLLKAQRPKGAFSIVESLFDSSCCYNKNAANGKNSSCLQSEESCVVPCHTKVDKSEK